MRITFILPVASQNGGVRVAATYARLLQERGHLVTVVSQPLWKPRGRKARLRRLLRLEKPKPFQPTPLLDCLGDRHRVLERGRPVEARDLPDADIVVATWWHTAEWVARLPASKGRKVYLLQDYEVFPHLPMDRVAATYRFDMHKIAVSSYIRDTIQTNHGINGIEVVPNAVDLDQFKALPRSRNTDLTVGFLYTPVQRKNVLLAIESLELARHLVPGLKALAFGRKHPSDELLLPDWIAFRQAPDQAEIPGIYAACDLWLFTSDHEGFGLPILEAMACRTPVLATRAGAAPELVNGENGLLLPGDPQAFAREIARFAGMSDAEWLRYSVAAHATATAYTWEDAADRFLASLRQACTA
ncbi:glycosyltransferase family 4 protein [Rhodovulum steppense]|uniref:Glycosyltransferase involved in cell wall biosynthesis n=1 Tax=Rhodovulum steppense TaxID=540251 RepID=A0A4R1YHW2_9RHOB|nr:glycosyltransferase family 4 protein [Rhodovulum steppense]TCM75883.1 glycosyltransferase involved in cell wall biosynthesis [Rhodovulum steppense]